ncbi:MAG: DNA cytosine methyltransferase, partial [Azoarcus sp.]|nr:DNA cytosine methyltransferase [Azoarcus sp.]
MGGWPYALRLAGWPDGRAAWTGSCPCQPFSVAGKAKGADDARHLWPAWHRLLEVRRPPVIFGEQVDGAVRHGWLDIVSADLESLGYAVGAAVLPAAGAGAPHGRHRLFFVADADGGRLKQASVLGLRAHAQHDAEPFGATGGMADAERHGRQGRLSGRADQEREAEHGSSGCHGATGGMADAESVG